MQRLWMLFGLLLVGSVAANSFVLNSAEWRTAQAFGARPDVRAVGCGPVPRDARAACFGYSAFTSTFKSTMDRFMTAEAPDFPYVRTPGDWADEGRSVVRTYLIYETPMVVSFDGRLVIFLTRR